MTIDQAIALIAGLLQATISVSGPLLGAALVGGVFIGVLQTATQINEMSVAYVVKAACLLLVFLLGGATLAEKTVSFARTSFTAVADVVH